MTTETLVLKYLPLDSLTVTSEFGKRVHPITGVENKEHQGMDFRAKDPTDLYNTHDGIVIFAGTADGYGNTVIIQDPQSGRATLYAHLSEIYKKNIEDPLSSRTLIGKTGNSGPDGTQPHLHFEILRKEIADKVKQEGTIKKTWDDNNVDNIESSALTLPNNQTLFFMGFPAANLTQKITDIFYETEPSPTAVPTLAPTFFHTTPAPNHSPATPSPSFSFNETTIGITAGVGAAALLVGTALCAFFGKRTPADQKSASHKPSQSGLELKHV